MKKIIHILLTFLLFITFTGCDGNMQEQNSFKLLSVVNFKVADGSAVVSEAAFTKLSYASDDVSGYLGYEGKLQSAVFDEAGSKIVVTLVDGSTEEVLIDRGDYSHVDPTAEATLTSLEKKAIGSKDGGAVMIGDSLFANWTDPALDMGADKPLYNFGVGGLCVADLQNIVLYRLVLPVSPSTVIIHVGVNDIFQGGHGRDVYLRNIKKLVDDIKFYLPRAEIYFVSIVRPTDAAPTVTGLTGAAADARRQEIDEANTEMKSYAEETGKLVYVDADGSYSDKYGRSDAAKFYFDGIHLLPDAYPAWGADMAKIIFGK